MRSPALQASGTSGVTHRPHLARVRILPSILRPPAPSVRPPGASGNGTSSSTLEASSNGVRHKGATVAEANGNGNGSKKDSPATEGGMAAFAAAMMAAASAVSSPSKKTSPSSSNNSSSDGGSTNGSSSAHATNGKHDSGGSNGSGGEGDLKQQLQNLRQQVEQAERERQEAEARAQQAESRSQEAHDALVQTQELATQLNKQYNELAEQLEALKSSRASSSSSSGGAQGGGDLARQVEDLQAQLEDLDYRLGWALRDLRAHQLVLRAQGELSLHLSGLPSSMQQQIYEQVDSGAELLGDGGSATVHAITVNGQQLAVKVMPLFDINTARPYHFRDICTTFLRHERSPYIELPLHTFLRLKDDEVEGTQYYLYTVWPRRHMDVDQLLCSRALQDEEIMTVMHHTVLALQDLAVARMVHADVKPPNVLVMLGADGLVTSAHLTDFGSVQFVPQGEQAAPAIWDGQLAWNWPPEQRDWVHLEACDAWGLALLYSCMKVHNPSKPDVTDVLQDLSNSSSAAEFERVRDQELLPERPEDPPEMRSLTRLMRRCVVKDPRKRPGIRELAGAIQVLREQMQMQKRAALGRR